MPDAAGPGCLQEMLDVAVLLPSRREAVQKGQGKPGSGKGRGEVQAQALVPVESQATSKRKGNRSEERICFKCEASSKEKC